MKRKIFGLFSIVAVAMLGIAAIFSVSVRSALAEDEAPTIVVSQIEHGKVSIKDAKESYEVGEVVVLDVEPATFYLLDSVSVNETSLVASESGEYSFALVSGENKISATFKVDEALLGEFAGAYESAQQGDWKNVFSVQNILIVVSFLFNSGILVALVRSFIINKRNGKSDQDAIVEKVGKIVPEETQKIIDTLLKDLLLPYITNISAHMDDVVKMCQKFIQAYLYSLDGTMESKDKIISLLSGLNLSDQNTIDEMRIWFTKEMERIESKAEEHQRLITEMKESTKKALDEAKKILPQEKEEQQTEKDNEKEEHTYDGTSI